MKIIPLFGGGTFGKSAVVTRQKRINCYYENRPDQDKSKVVVYGTPGMVSAFNLPLTPGSLIKAFQGTQSALYAVAQVPVSPQQFISINPLGNPNNQLLSASMTAGNALGSVGYSQPSSYGSLSPNFDGNGNTISSFTSYEHLTGSVTLSIASSQPLGMGYFYSITVAELSVTLLSSAATYSFAGGISTWVWTPSIALNTGSTYTVSITSSAGSIVFNANLSTDTGNVEMAYSPSQVLIVDSAYGYVYNGTTLNPVSMWPAPAQTCTYVGGFFVIEQPNSQKFWVSNFGDATTWNPLSFASAASDSDNLVAVDQLLGNLVLFMNIGCEFWQNQGLSPQPFAPILSAANQYGLAAIESRGHVDQSIIYLAQNPEGGIQFIEIINSYVPQVISDADIDYIINTFTTVSDAVSLVYQIGQHKFYQCTFPTEGYSFLFDCSSRQWSYTQSGLSGRHLANLSTYYNGQTLLTDSSSTQIYTMDDNTYTDNGQTIVREIITRHVLSNFNRVRPSLLYLDMETGVGLQTGQGSNPQVMVQYSKDDGRTWSGERWMSLGAVGAYQTRMVLRRFGSTRTATWRIRMTDPVKFVITEGAIKIAERQPAAKLG